MIEASKDKAYDVDSRIPEIYDAYETQTEDITLYRHIRTGCFLGETY